jgi:hypothetical protein
MCRIWGKRFHFWGFRDRLSVKRNYALWQTDFTGGDVESFVKLLSRKTLTVFFPSINYITGL